MRPAPVSVAVATTVHVEPAAGGDEGFVRTFSGVRPPKFLESREVIVAGPTQEMTQPPLTRCFGVAATRILNSA